MKSILLMFDFMLLIFAYLIGVFGFVTNIYFFCDYFKTLDIIQCLVTMFGIAFFHSIMCWCNKMISEAFELCMKDSPPQDI